MVEPDSLVLVLLRELRGDVANIRSEMATRADLAELRSELHSEMNSLRADVAADTISLEKRLGDRIGHLNKAVVEYHSSVIGHGMLITEMDERLRRVENHLKLTPG